MKKVFWDDTGKPITTTIDQLMDDLFNEDMQHGLMDEPCLLDDVLEDVELMTFDGIVSEYSKLAIKMRQMKQALDRAHDSIKVVSHQVSDPFKSMGAVQIVAIFELNDGQTISIFFHNPDTTPQKVSQDDELISFKWLMNKKDVTIAVAPENGQEVSIRKVASRIMQLVDKNSQGFQRRNTKRAERLANFEALKDRVAEKETTLEKLLNQIDILENEKSKVQADNDLAVADAKAGLDKYSAFFPKDELTVIQGQLKGEEAAGIAENINRLLKIIETMPVTYEQDGKGDAAIAYLHYFKGAGDWYITEKDMSGIGTRQAFGLAKIQEAELGYISIADLVSAGVELDLHFEPTAVGDFKNMPEPKLELETSADEGHDFTEIQEPKENEHDVIEVRGDEFGNFPDTTEGVKELRKTVFSYLKGLAEKNDRVFCPAVNADVEFTASGAKKYKQLSGNPIKLKIAAQIKQIIAQGKLFKPSEVSYDEHEKKSQLTYHYLKTAVSVDSVEYGARIVVREAPDGRFHYDLRVEDSVNSILDNADKEMAAPIPVNESGGGCHKEPHKAVLVDKSIVDLESKSQKLLDSGDSDGSMILNLFIYDENGQEIDSDVTLNPEILTNKTPQEPESNELATEENPLSAPEVQPEIMEVLNTQPEESKEDDNVINPDELDTDLGQKEGENLSLAVNRYIKENLQGRYVKSQIGDVLFNATSKKELGQGTLNNEIRARLVPFVPQTISHGSYQGKELLSKPKKDKHVAAIHKFRKELDINGLTVDHVVTVTERDTGELQFVAYHSRSDLSNKKGGDILDSISNIKVGRSRMPSPSYEEKIAMNSDFVNGDEENDITLDSIEMKNPQDSYQGKRPSHLEGERVSSSFNNRLGQDDENINVLDDANSDDDIEWNIQIIKVIDKDGNEIKELEDHPEDIEAPQEPESNEPAAEEDPLSVPEVQPEIADPQQSDNSQKLKDTEYLNSIISGEHDADFGNDEWVAEFESRITELSSGDLADLANEAVNKYVAITLSQAQEAGY